VSLSPLGQKLKLSLVPPVWRAYRASLRLREIEHSDRLSNPPYIFTCLHRDMLVALMHVRPAQTTLLVSNSPDGDILVKCLGHHHYNYVRGATGEDGRRAFVALRRALDAGHSVGVAVDGPKGPFGVINDGALLLSRLSGAAIVPLLATAPRSFSLGSWDRTVVPYFFSRVEMRQGKDLLVRRDAKEIDLIAARSVLRDFFGVQGSGHGHS